MYDEYNDEEIVLSKEEMRMIQRIRQGALGSISAAAAAAAAAVAAVCGGWAPGRLLHAQVAAAWRLLAEAAAAACLFPLQLPLLLIA